MTKSLTKAIVGVLLPRPLSVLGYSRAWLSTSVNDGLENAFVGAA